MLEQNFFQNQKKILKMLHLKNFDSKICFSNFFANSYVYSNPEICDNFKKKAIALGNNSSITSEFYVM